MDKIETWGRGQKHQTLEVQRIPKDKLDLRVKQAAIPLNVRADSVTASGPTESEDTQRDYSQLDPLRVRAHSVTTASWTHGARGHTGPRFPPSALKMSRKLSKQSP